MRTHLISFLIILTSLAIQGCLPNAGCLDNTAENYDPEAEENDGSCIPSRKKLIGQYSYTRTWTDVYTELDSADMGEIQVTEAGSASNEFHLNLDGERFLHGAITGVDIVMTPYSNEETYFGLPYTRSYTGAGTWLVEDSVDVFLTLTTRVPTLDTSSSELVLVPQDYNYYLTKVE